MMMKNPATLRHRRLKALFRSNAGRLPDADMFDQIERALAGLPQSAFTDWLDDLFPRVTRSRGEYSEGFYVNDARKFAERGLKRTSSEPVIIAGCPKCNPIDSTDSEPGIIHTPAPELGNARLKHWCTCRSAREQFYEPIAGSAPPPGQIGDILMSLIRTRR
jgi:hypothetical protein